MGENLKWLFEPLLKKPPPIKRLDSANAKRLDSEAAGYLAAPPGTKLDANDRKLMIEAIEARPGVASVAERPDDYLCARFVAMRGDDVPADGMSPGSVVYAEVKGGAKLERTKINAYLNRARTELSAGAARSSFPNPGDVETRAYELAQLDPEGLFK